MPKVFPYSLKELKAVERTKDTGAKNQKDFLTEEVKLFHVKREKMLKLRMGNGELKGEKGI